MTNRVPAIIFGLMTAFHGYMIFGSVRPLGDQAVFLTDNQPALVGGSCPNRKCLTINCIVNQAENNQCGYGGENGQTCTLVTDEDKCVAVVKGENSGKRCQGTKTGWTCTENLVGPGCAIIKTGDPVDGDCPSCPTESGTCGTDIAECNENTCPG